jgi:hypothetical protein
MLYLAQVKKNLVSGKFELELLASQENNQQIWQIINSEYVPLDSEEFTVGVLVLLEYQEDGTIINIENATNWVLDLIQKYLTNSLITPEFIAEEGAKIERWRQEIAQEGQDLTRRHLELETRREELQELEKSLKREKEKLEVKLKEL